MCVCVCVCVYISPVLSRIPTLGLDPGEHTCPWSSEIKLTLMSRNKECLRTEMIRINDCIDLILIHYYKYFEPSLKLSCHWLISYEARTRYTWDDLMAELLVCCAINL